MKRLEMLRWTLICHKPGKNKQPIFNNFIDPVPIHAGYVNSPVTTNDLRAVFPSFQSTIAVVVCSTFVKNYQG
ncbi:hypothetical protein MKX03_026644 [Papaver bracteatum]|nr:hypothetical protein MKX03_026644 [Papaver bracteatum]